MRRVALLNCSKVCPVVYHLTSIVLRARAPLTLTLASSWLPYFAVPMNIDEILKQVSREPDIYDNLYGILGCVPSSTVGGVYA